MSAPDAVTTITVATKAGRFGEGCTALPAPSWTIPMNDLCVAESSGYNAGSENTEAGKDEKEKGTGSTRRYLLREVKVR